MASQIIIARTFDDAVTLAHAIEDLLADMKAYDPRVSPDAVFVKSDGFRTSGVAQLHEVTLTDGSKVYDIVLADAD